MQPILDLLGFQPGEGVQFGVMSGSGVMSRRTWTDLALASAWLSRGVDRYICGNPITPGCGDAAATAAQVEVCRWLLVDADPLKTPEDPQGVSQASRDAAGQVANEVFEFVGQRAVLLDSGRGFQVWLRVQPDIERTRLGRWLRHTFPRPGAAIDGTSDPSRLMRLPGSTNSRTGRQAVVIHPGLPDRITREEVETWTEGFSTGEAAESSLYDSSPPTPADRFFLRGEPRKIWEEDCRAVLDRSKRDFRFALALTQMGAGSGTVSRLLWALPGSKAQERGQDYWDSILRAVLAEVAEVAEDQGVAERVSAVLAEGDVAATIRCLYADCTLRALARLERDSPQEWAILRAKLSVTRGVRVGDIDKRVAAAGAALRVPLAPPDDLVRAVQEGDRLEWLSQAVGQWAYGHKSDALLVLPPAQAVTLLRAAAANRWTLTNRPFEPEILPGRTWNRSTVRWRCEAKEGPYDMWRQMFRVVGRGLDHACKPYGLSGGDYLEQFFTLVCREPFHRLPYLFVWSNHMEIGKSTLGHAFNRHLVSGAYLEASSTLLNATGFNSELEFALLCDVGEHSMARGSRSSYVHPRIKLLVTEPTLTLQTKGRASRTVDNSTHWIQSANNAGACPIFRGDARVTAWYMDKLAPEEVVSDREFHRRLAAEAPAWRFAIENCALPDQIGRLWLPVLETVDKATITRVNESEVDSFAARHPQWVWWDMPEIYRVFQETLEMPSTIQRYGTRVIQDGLVSRREEHQLWVLAQQLREVAQQPWAVSELAAHLDFPTGAVGLGHALAELARRDPSRLVRWTSGRASWVKVR